MGVKVESPRGFAVFAEGISEAVARETSGEIEAVLDKFGVSPTDMENLRQRYQALGESGVDIQRLDAEDMKRYRIDPRHAKANKAIFATLTAARKKAPSGGVIGFRAT